jgi:undecaprenyl-diphosphatase
MSIFQVVLLSIVQGLAELLPVSSSAHVVVAEKLLGMDPSAPAMTLLLVMLHTGTMFAVIVYFWKQWRATYFESAATFKSFAWLAILATFWTALIGGGLIEFIEHVLLRGTPHAEVEQLFGRLDLIAPALAVAGILILIAGLYEKKREGVLGANTTNPGATNPNATNPVGLDTKQAGWMGAVQGLCLPFRGFSRSGATISVGMLMGVAKTRAEAFSFALAVVLTPPAIAREAMRLVKAEHLHHSAALASASLASALAPSLLGAVCSFLAGLVALKWLSRWLESGRWYWFGIYCLVASVAVAVLHHIGF